jgi:hypothetical protein
MDPGMAMQKVLDQLAAMNGAAIPQKDNRTTQMTEQLLEKLHHFFSPEGAPMELDIERHALALGRYGQGVKGVDASLSVPHGAVRGLPLGSPSAFKVGDEQKATFVQENQVRAKTGCLFLYAASGSVPNAQSRPRRAGASAVRVSDNSSLID